MNMMLEKMNYCKRNKKVASIFCDKADSNLHLTGYVEQFNENELLISHISIHGYYDGYILKRVDDIYRIDYDGEYEEKIEQLYNFKGQSHALKDRFNEDKEEILYLLLDYAKNNDYIISLEFENNLISGSIESYEDNIVCLKIINEYGFEKGVSVIDIDEVITISVDTDDEQDLKILCKINTN